MQNTFQSYDQLPVGVLALKDGAVAYANDTAVALLGVARERLVERAARELALEVLPRERDEWLFPLVESFARPADLPADVWLRLSPPGHPQRTVRATRVVGQGGLELVVLVEAEGDVGTERLVEAMVLAAGELVRCRDERSVLELAADAIHRQGYFVATLLVEGDALVHGPMRQDPASVARAERLYGQKISEIRFPLDSMPHLVRAAEARRGAFTADLFEITDHFHAPDVARMMRETMPVSRAVDAPMFVEGALFGFLSVQGTTVTAPCAPIVELFTQLLAGAIENVRHLRRATQQLREREALERELLDRERLAALGNAAAAVSHEARNPLGAILNALAVLKRTAPPDGDTREMIEIAQEEALRLDALVRDLSELARPLEPRLRPVRLRALLEANVKERALEIHGPAELPEALVDPALIQVAVENLLRNAAQVGEAPVRMSLEAEDKVLVLAVEDSAGARWAGRDGEPFDPFSAARPQGSGLGLAVVKRLIEAQGGSVRARQGGARVEIVLPIAP